MRSSTPPACASAAPRSPRNASGHRCPEPRQDQPSERPAQRAGLFASESRLHGRGLHGSFRTQERTGGSYVKQIEAAVIGVGWVGGTRAETLARTALVDKLHLCDIRPDRLAE